MKNLKILISGAGVAGLTIAGLLKQNNNNIEFDLIERQKEDEFNTSGYMLGLLPLGGRLFNQLNLRQLYFDQSIQMENYIIHDENGKKVKSFPLDFINEKYGSYRGISRINLIDILLKKIDKSSIHFNKTIRSLKQNQEEVKVIFSDDEEKVYDLVIIAEGIHSKTREKILKEDEYEYYNTNWGGWVSWLNRKPFHDYAEYWGAGSFLGLYPVKDKIGVFLGGPVDEIKEIGLSEFKNKVKDSIKYDDELAFAALDTFDNNEKPFFWEFHDCKSDRWLDGNIILLGDSATGFLPTAGVGASMAMDSAAALADEISRIDKEHINYGLELFVKRQKERVEKAQKDSRNLGKMMFIKSTLITKGRNEMLKFYTLEQMLSDLSKVMEGE